MIRQAAFALLLASFAVLAAADGNGNGNGNGNGHKSPPPPAGGGGDPLMYDFTGRQFEFMGKSGEFYNIYSDSAHQINMGLFDAYLNGHNGTYMGSYGISCGNSRVNVTLIGQGDLLVEMWQDKDQERSAMVSGHAMQAVIGDEICKLSIKMEAFETPGGHTVEVKSDVLTVSIRTAPAGEIDSLGIAQPAFLNFELALSRRPVGDKATGIIGDSLHQLKGDGDKLTSRSDDSVAIKEEADKNKRPEDDHYHVTGMFGTDFAANVFSGAAVSSPVGTSRRSLRYTDAFAGVKFPLTAFSA